MSLGAFAALWDGCGLCTVKGEVVAVGTAAQRAGVLHCLCRNSRLYLGVFCSPLLRNAQTSTRLQSCIRV